MRFNIIVNDGDEKCMRDELKPFDVRDDKEGGLTIELNSWHAFETLQKSIGSECTVYSKGVSDVGKYPLLEFNTGNDDESWYDDDYWEEQHDDWNPEMDDYDYYFGYYDDDEDWN